tara:strand:- start:893 stop:1279 length:387 start_codon:yes stop_codon:yes gene_type:complete
MDIKRYNIIRKDSTTIDFNVTTHIPVITEKDIKRGYITRYFIQKTNDKGAPIYEVNRSTNSYYSSKPHFMSVKLRWRITGPMEVQYDSIGTIIEKPVSESNRISIKMVAYEIPNLKLYLPNLLQFYKK